LSSKDIKNGAYIDFIANDDDGDYSVANVHCGRVMIEGEKEAWHDPIDNPMLCLYSQGGHLKQWHGSFGRKIRDGSGDHAAVDIFALPKTNVYACVDGIVSHRYTSTTLAGRVISIKVSDKKAFMARRDLSFQPQFADKGELVDSNFNYDGDIYLVYHHLDEFLVELGQEVKCGDTIALSGISGRNGVNFSTKNPHLHFEITNAGPVAGLNGKCNPAMFFDIKNESEMTQSEKQKQLDAKNKGY
jgi:murein DD-endopeptidase MepM/ murein hydrolase activator NlpD